jgi:hypothetical protein
MAILHSYESYLIRQLPLNAQRAAENLLAKTSLAELLQLGVENDMDSWIMDSNKVSRELAPDILRAVLLARLTYFEASPLLDQEKILLLVKLAVETLGFSLSTPLPQIVSVIKADYPVLTKWLAMMAQQLVKCQPTSSAEDKVIVPSH